jgi:hypothetical protein
MSEPTPEVPAAPPAPEAQEQQPAEQNVEALPEWAREAISKANKEAAGYRTKVRELEPLAEEAQKLKEAQQTEAERIAARATAAERERDEAKAEGLRYKAAATHGVGEDYFDLLGSDNDEAITGRAVAFGELTKVKAEVEHLRAENEALRAGKPVPTNGRPVESLRPGASPVPVPPVGDTDYPSHWFPKSHGASTGT